MFPYLHPVFPVATRPSQKWKWPKIPIFGFLYKTGSVLVDRKSEASRRESFAKMKEVLDMGLHMCIYPEGTRNKTDQPLKSFHDGAFRLALLTKKASFPRSSSIAARQCLLQNLFFFCLIASPCIFCDPSQSAKLIPWKAETKIFEVMKNYC